METEVMYNTDVYISCLNITISKEKKNYKQKKNLANNYKGTNTYYLWLSYFFYTC